MKSPWTHTTVLPFPSLLPTGFAVYARYEQNGKQIKKSLKVEI